MSNVERLAALVTTFVVSLAIGLLVDPPWNWALLGVTMLLVCLGAEQIVYANWRVKARRRRYAVTAWTLPALATVTAFLFLRLPIFYSGIGMGLGLAAAAVLLAVIVIAQYRSLDPADPFYRHSRMALSLVVYLIALGSYSAIYAPKARSLLSATAVLAVSTVFALEVLRSEEGLPRRTALCAVVVGVVLGQITWALNYWVVNALAGGAILLLAFYVLAGLAQSHLTGELSRRVAVEFGVVAAFSICLVLVSLVAV